jgi:aminoglycoside phosphotransferase (APT) family kinase protein
MHSFRDTRSVLTQAGIAHYLLSLGVVKPSAIVDDELSVLDASRRNAVFIAAARSGPAYVVKQARPGTAATLAHEAQVLRALGAMPAVRGLVPEVVHEDRAAECLVLRSPADARDWSEHHRDGRFSPRGARTLGSVLAMLHELPADDLEDPPPGIDRLWGLTLPEPSYELVLELSAAAVDLLVRVQASDFLCERLRRIQDVTAADGLVHGDLRWENCLAVAPPGGRRRTRVLLVDWELAGFGPAGFDVGTLLAGYLGKWVASIPMPDPRDPSRFVDHARHPLVAMRPAIHAFWAAYRSARRRPPELAEVVELAGVRLLQTALEHAGQTHELSAHAVATTQLAAHLLHDPAAAALALLGLRE